MLAINKQHYLEVYLIIRIGLTASSLAVKAKDAVCWLL
jgi:hypothetical protein